MRYRAVGTGELVEAVQYVADGPLPAGVEMRTVLDPGTGQQVEKAMLATKDPEGDVDVADGCWIVAHEDGTVALCHPVAFEREYEEDGQ